MNYEKESIAISSERRSDEVPCTREREPDCCGDGCLPKGFVELRRDLLTNKYTRVYYGHVENGAPNQFIVTRKSDDSFLNKVTFQNGAIREAGVNGCCNEDLINMVIERLECFQNSEFKCRENDLAITALEEALLWLRKRTMGREQRGVEGTHEV